MDDQREAELVATLIDADPPEQVVPVPSIPLLAPNQLATIAREIATNVYPIEDIIAKFDLTPAQYAAHVFPNGYFQTLLQSYAAEWESIKSTNKRLAFQAAAALEQSLPALAHRMGSKSEDFADAVGAAKLFTQLAGAGAQPGVPTTEAGQRFSIQINIGDHTVSVATTEEVPEQPKISADAEISGYQERLLELTAGEGSPVPPEPPATENGNVPEIRAVAEGHGDKI